SAYVFLFQAEDGIRDRNVTGVQTCALPISDEDLANIEKEMRKITKENLPIKAFILPRPEAIQLMEDRKEKFKVEHIGDLPEDARSEERRVGKEWERAKARVQWKRWEDSEWT